MNVMKNGTINRIGAKPFGGSSKVSTHGGHKGKKTDGNDRLQMLTIWQVNPLTLEKELRTVLVPRSFCISKRTN
ncbi:hypothetical protein N185_16060 [Sinorhizobium sp. GW3]|nr:hypothetical protein N185_16060 [Sinorhizobium sp. GW3]